MQPPKSCDTFVVLPSCTNNGAMIFGKNSDRPQGEVQEVVYFPSAKHPAGEKIKCTYIEVESAGDTLAVVLSKPAWMWGAEMGANEKGVCIGNEAVWTKVPNPAEPKRLLGMDLVRLGLERGATAREALDAICALLEKYGQGGSCDETDKSFTYHNSFIICDSKEAWVLETAGQLWAAEKCEGGFRNISNCLSIGTKIDLSSADLEAKAKELQLWKGEGKLDFAAAFQDGGDDGRYACGQQLLTDLTSSKSFDTQAMMKVLRAEKICRSVDSAFPTTGSQVSVLYSDGRMNCHWFTGTPDPSLSVFKPFVFAGNVSNSKLIVSPADGSDGRRHALYKRHAEALKITSDSGNEQGKALRLLLTELEERCIREMELTLANPNVSTDELADLFKDCVESEYKLYK